MLLSIQKNRINFPHVNHWHKGTQFLPDAFEDEKKAVLKLIQTPVCSASSVAHARVEPLLVERVYLAGGVKRRLFCSIDVTMNSEAIQAFVVALHIYFVNMYLFVWYNCNNHEKHSSWIMSNLCTEKCILLLFILFVACAVCQRWGAVTIIKQIIKIEIYVTNFY